MALAKALNAKTTVITVMEPLPVIEYVSGHAGGGISQQDWDAACKVRAGKVLDEARRPNFRTFRPTAVSARRSSLD